jgi:transcriptional regulator NrdR family protein
MTTFSQAVIALRNNDSFALVVEEIKSRRETALQTLVASDGVGFARVQGMYRAFDDLISDIEKAEELANLTSDNRRKRPETV